MVEPPTKKKEDAKGKQIKKSKMKATTFKHENVLPNGTISDRPGFTIPVSGGIEMSRPGREDFFIAVIEPLKDGVVEITFLNFDDQQALDKFIDGIQ